MKKILISLLVFASLFSIQTTIHCFAIEDGDTSENILTDSFDKVLETDDIQDPLRDGAYGIVGGDSSNPDDSISSILKSGKITEHQTAMDNTLNLIKRTVNYLL